MDKEGQRKTGEIAGALGFLLLALNIVDYLAGWNAIADETALAGAALVIAGAYFALK